MINLFSFSIGCENTKTFNFKSMRNCLTGNVYRVQLKNDSFPKQKHKNFISHCTNWEFSSTRSQQIKLSNKLGVLKSFDERIPLLCVWIVLLSIESKCVQGKTIFQIGLYWGKIDLQKSETDFLVQTFIFI